MQTNKENALKCLSEKISRSPDEPIYMLYKNILANIPSSEFKRVMSQCCCEYSWDFYGFCDVYETALSLLDTIPQNKRRETTIIDLGCYLAFQSYMFTEYKRYIGVDSSAAWCSEERFAPPNAKHYGLSIQDFIKEYAGWLKLENCFAICSYVPDFEACKMAMDTFPNYLVYYPGEYNTAKLNGVAIESPHRDPIALKKLK